MIHGLDLTCPQARFAPENFIFILNAQMLLDRLYTNILQYGITTVLLYNNIYPNKSGLVMID